MLITIEKTFGLRCVLVLLAVILGLHSSGLAQDASGRVIGTVTDPTGAVIPKAKITITNVATGVTRDTTSQADGTYQVLAVPIGLYRVSAEAQGFRRITTAPEKLEINQALRIDVRMEVGATTETVQVEANASSIETVTATLGASVTSTQIAAAPLNGRNVLDLALFVPGVIPSSRSSGAGSFSVSGSRQDSVTYLLDGGVNNNLLSNGVVYSPNPDTVEEFKILVNNYTAEYGRTGGGIVSVVTKSGSNAFHGALYDYLRNEKMNANSFFNNANKLPKEVLKRNQFGATVGGPILLPKVNGKDRFFFFLGYQGQRLAALSTTAKITV
ncbi:MAG: carboxypeptidase regulatory-like domain-containing protein, partial [Acidobacteria bacterium]|nr:carboxypeptidase regulatory-like domain-containing protein [Acidobacteriota bacterium]